MQLLKIDRGNVSIEIGNNILKISGEAMLPKPFPEMSEYVIYENSLSWQNDEAPPEINKKELFTFLEKEFAKRNLLLILEQ